jgi:hypothetical protein
MHYFGVMIQFGKQLKSILGALVMEVAMEAAKAL